MNPTVLYISITLPSLTLTFVAREIEALRRLGVRIRTLSMNRTPVERLDTSARGLLETTHFLDSVPTTSKLWEALRVLIRRPRAFKRAFRVLLSSRVESRRDLLRISYHFVEACYASVYYRDAGIDRIHCHFLSGPTSIGMFLAALLEIPFSFTIHGSHVYRRPIALATKLQRADFVVSVSDVHRKHVVGRYGEEFDEKFHTIRAGVDLARFPCADARPRTAGPVRLLTVARLVRLKGLHHVIRACSLLRDRGHDFVYAIVGEGPERDSLEDLVRSNGLESRVELVGARIHDEVLRFYEESEVFVLAAVKDGEGARDGLPVVLMEAMASGLPVVSSDFVGIPELVQDRVHGFLTKPGDEPELADALQRLLESRDLRERMGRRGRERILRDFDVRQSAAALRALFVRGGPGEGASA